MIYDSCLFGFNYLFSYLSVSYFRFSHVRHPDDFRFSHLRHPDDTFKDLKLSRGNFWTSSRLCDSKIILFTVHFVFQIPFLIPWFVFSYFSIFVVEICNWGRQANIFYKKLCYFLLNNSYIYRYRVIAW